MPTSPLPNLRWLLAVLAAAGLAAGGAYLAYAIPGLEHSLAQAQNLLQRARDEHTVTADPQIARIPLDQLDVPQDRKDAFIAQMLPLIARENRRLRNLRAEAQAARPGTAAYAALAHAFALPPNAPKTHVLRRIDRVPVSLALAQAAEESAWGTSRFAIEANAYFGERTYDADEGGLSPEGATGFKVKGFATPALSVRSYMMTLNTHPAYQQFRRRRAALRDLGVPLAGLDLVSSLTRYSETGTTYIQRLLHIIRANRLDEFDAVEFERE